MLFASLAGFWFKLMCLSVNLLPISSVIPLFTSFFDLLLWNHFMFSNVPSLVSSLAWSFLNSSLLSIPLWCKRRCFPSLHNSLIFTHVDELGSGLVAM